MRSVLHTHVLTKHIINSFVVRVEDKIVGTVLKEIKVIQLVFVNSMSDPLIVWIVPIVSLLILE